MVAKSERRWALTFAVVVMLITTVPYVLGYASQGEAWRFSGFLFGVEDGNSYIGKMLSGSAGAWFFRTPYTATPQRGVLAFFPYILLGKLSAPPGQHEQLVVLFHIFRVVAGVLAIVATYDFLSIYLNNTGWRRFGTVLITLGGGLGWILLLLGRETWLGTLPLEFYSPETFGFLALYGLPHLAMARALLLWGFRAYLGISTVKKRSWNNSIVAGSLWLLMGLFQPLTVVVAWAVVAAHTGVFWLRQLLWKQAASIRDEGVSLVVFRNASLAILVSSPIVIYTFLAFNTDPFLRTWTEQNRIPSPHPAHYLLAFGLVLPFAIAGAIQMLRSDKLWMNSLPPAWLLILPLLAYAPHNLQRRLPEGGWVVLVLLAMVYFESKSSSRSSKKVLSESVLRLPDRLKLPVIPGYKAVFLLLFLFPSTLILFVGGVGSGLAPHQPLFLPGEQIEVFEYLAANTTPGAVVLSVYYTGNALPAYAPVRVVIGHGPESVGLEILRPKVAEFFSTMTSEQRSAFLAESQVAYVFWGPEERNIGSWQPEQEEFLTLADESGNYQVYRVLGDR